MRKLIDLFAIYMQKKVITVTFQLSDLKEFNLRYFLRSSVWLIERLRLILYAF